MLLSLLTIGTTEAQLLRKLGKAAANANTTSNTVNAVDGISKSATVKKGVGDAAATGLKLDWNMFRQTPAISFNSLLYGTSIGLSGQTRFDSYTATFVPNRKADGSNVNTTTDQAEYLKVKVFKGDQYITYFEYDGTQQFDDGKKTKFNAPTSRYQRDGEWVGGTDIDVKKWGAGKYRLDFIAGDKMFYSFDFEIAKLTNPDTYASISEMYVTRGPWNNYAYMSYADSGNLLFGFYLNHEEFQPDKANNRKTNKSVKWSVKMFRDNKLYAQQYGNGPNVAQVKQASWEDNQCAFKLVDKPGEVKSAALADGAYKLEVAVEGEAKPRIYKFDVKDKRIVQIAEQDRARNTDPTRLIEGWNDYFWMKLEK